MTAPDSVPVLPAEVIASLRIWHDALGWSCVAAGEGQRCCIDDLIAAAQNAPVVPS